MRIIHIVHGNSMSGAQRYALDLCRHYTAAGHDVIALTREARAIDIPFAEAGVRLCHAPLRDYPDLFSTLALRPLLEEAPAGECVVHVHRYRDALTAIAARRLARRPDIRIVVTRHISGPAKDNPLRRFIYSRVDTHIFVSEFSRREFLTTWKKGHIPFDTSRLHVAFNSRNIPEILTGDPLPEPSRGAVTAMYHGTVRPGKGLTELITAMSKIRSTRLRLRIAGNGDPDYCDYLRRLAIALGVMDMIDWQRNPGDPAELIPAAHFGVLPSILPEAFGMANLEYMAAGRPQITTFNGAQPEYLRPGEEALEVAPGDVDALAEAMLRLATDPDLRRRLGQKARRRYLSTLAWPHFISRINNIYGIKE